MLDLTNYVRGEEGDPESATQQATFMVFDEPKEVEFTQQGEKKTETFEGGVCKVKKLTFRTLIMRALRAQNQSGKNLPDTDRRTKLIGSIIADKASLSDEDRGDIIKCVRAQGDPLHLYRLKEFFAGQKEVEKSLEKNGRK